MENRPENRNADASPDRPPPDTIEGFAYRVRDLFTATGMSTDQFQRLHGFPDGLVSKCQNGKQAPPIEFVMALLGEAKVRAGLRDEAAGQYLRDYGQLLQALDDDGRGHHVYRSWFIRYKLTTSAMHHEEELLEVQEESRRLEEEAASSPSEERKVVIRALIQDLAVRQRNAIAQRDAILQKLADLRQVFPEPDTGEPQATDDSQPIGAGGRSGWGGKGLRVALVSTACLALLSGGGWLTWNHLHAGRGSSESKPPQQPQQPQQPQYTLADSDTLKRAEAKGKIVIGVKQDQPGLSETNADGSNARGFEIDLARFLIEEIGFQGEIDFKPLTSGNREAELNGNKVDLVIATYSITTKREKEVNFSVPYYDTGQALLMHKGREKGEFQTWDEADAKITYTKVNGLDDLPDGTDSCTVKSTSLDFMEKPEFENKFDINGRKSSYKDCIKGLLEAGEKGSYEVVSTDEVILAGLAHEYGEKKLALPPFIFTHEHYGVGMRKGDPALQYLTCLAIKKSIADNEWEKFYNKHLKKIMGEPANPPSEPVCKGRQSTPAGG